MCYVRGESKHLEKAQGQHVGALKSETRRPYMRNLASYSIIQFYMEVSGQASSTEGNIQGRKVVSKITCHTPRVNITDDTAGLVSNHHFAACTPLRMGSSNQPSSHVHGHASDFSNSIKLLPCA